VQGSPWRRVAALHRGSQAIRRVSKPRPRQRVRRRCPPDILSVGNAKIIGISLTTLKTNSISARSRAARTSKFPRVWQGPRVPQDLRGSGHGSSVLIASASFASPSCLERIMSKEVVPRRDRRNSSSNVVKPTIFVPGSMPRSTDAASTPFILGMLRSRITRAGACSLAFSMAATPSSASQQALKGVALSMKLQMAPRTAALSSTTRIHGVRGDDITKESY